jgi:hypothetical protein
MTRCPVLPRTFWPNFVSAWMRERICPRCTPASAPMERTYRFGETCAVGPPLTVLLGRTGRKPAGLCPAYTRVAAEFAVARYSPGHACCGMAPVVVAAGKRSGCRRVARGGPGTA